MVKIFDYLGVTTKLFGDRTGAFILALPTVPLRRSHHVDGHCSSLIFWQAHFLSNNYGFPISFSFSITDSGCWEPLLPESPMNTGNTRSQNQIDFYHPNGAIYVRNIEDLSNTQLTTLYVDALPYLMSRNDSVDIDNAIDFKIAEALYSKYRL